MTRAERKEKARLRCEERVNGYKLSARKYVDQMNPTLEKGVRHIQQCARNETRKIPQMKEEIERCQGEAAKWFVEEYAGKLKSEEDYKLTSDQIRHWRNALLLMGFGPYALIMPDEDIQRFRDNLQKRIDEDSRKNEQEVFGFLQEEA